MTLSAVHKRHGWVKIKNHSRILVFLVGICCGMMFSITFFSAFRYTRISVAHRGKFMYDRLDKMLQLQPEAKKVLREMHSKTETFHQGEDIVAEEMSAAVRVLCLVLTTQDSYSKSAEAIKNTWGPRCNTLLFVSNFEDSALPVVKLYAGKDKLQNWALMKSALKHISIHHIETHDWVLRVDDNTFVVVENLRYLLSQYKPSEALYFGCRFKKYVKQGFMSGGAGYVLSKEAIKRVAHEGITKELCSVKDDGKEDVEMGKCMETLVVTPVDTRDSLGRGRFFPFSPDSHLIPDTIKSDSWYWDMVYYPAVTGFNCCSDTAITFHGISDRKMYVLNYLVYHLRPYGINSPIHMNETNLYVVTS